MRKFIIALICVITMLTACLAGCSCVGTQPLSFNCKFFGENAVTDPSLGYKETLTYNVEYLEKRSDLDGKSSLLNDVNFTFTNGIYVSTLEMATSLPDGITSDITIDLPSDASTLYKLTTKLSITSTYSGLDEGNGEYQDFIESTVYFCSFRLSYAPIYSIVKTDYSVLFVTDTASSVKKLQSEREITYSKDKYVIKETVADNQTSNEYEYEFMTVIDNAQLLFALRNIDVSKESSFSLPTVSYAYGEAKNLRIDNESQTTNPVELVVNGTEIKDNMPLNNYAFMINDATKAGIPQYVEIQSAKSDNLVFNALLHSYVEPLTAYGNMLSMGYLEYTLSNVEIIK